MQLTAIVAIDHNDLMGVNGAMPWHCKKDMQHFKQVTEGQVVIMGRLTWESLPKRPLPDRVNIVVSNNPHVVSGCRDSFTVPTFERALKLANTFDGQVFVIGGSQLFKEALPKCSTLLLTVVHQNTPVLETDSPVYFDTGVLEEFEQISEGSVQQSDTHECTFLKFYRR